MDSIVEHNYNYYVKIIMRVVEFFYCTLNSSLNFESKLFVSENIFELIPLLLLGEFRGQFNVPWNVVPFELSTVMIKQL